MQTIKKIDAAALRAFTEAALKAASVNARRAAASIFLIVCIAYPPPLLRQQKTGSGLMCFACPLQWRQADYSLLYCHFHPKRQSMQALWK